MLTELLWALLPAVLGLALWRGLVAPRLAPAPLPGPSTDDNPHLLLLFLLAWIGMAALTASAGLALADHDPANLDLEQMLGIQAGANLVVVGLMLLWLRGVRGGWRALGLVATRPGLTWLAALAGWLACLPVLDLAKRLNTALLEWLGHSAQVQDYLQRFLDEGGMGSAWAWIAMGALIPIGEELLFRGALQGGLRRVTGPVGAMLLSALVFGAAHAAPVKLPVFALGVLLAWLRERTGGLAAPCLVHMLQNLATLAVAGFCPDFSP